MATVEIEEQNKAQSPVKMATQSDESMSEAMFPSEAATTPAVVDVLVERQIQQYAKEHPLEILSLTASGDEEHRPQTFQEKMLKAYQGESMETAIKAFPYLYDIYARKAAVYQLATRDFAGLADEKRRDAIETVMVQFDLKAANTILHVDQMKFPRATNAEIHALTEMKAHGETAPLDVYHHDDTPQR